MTTRPVDLAELIRLGAPDLAHHVERDHRPATPLEWLGIAVAHLPELSARARTADDVHARSRIQSVRIREPLLDAVLGAVGAAAAFVDEARRLLVERHPDADVGDEAPEAFAEMLELAQQSAPRRAEMMIGAYASFIGGALEAAGSLSEAELGIALARRWEREDHERLATLRATQLHTALVNALGGLLAYARLVAADSRRLSDD